MNFWIQGLLLGFAYVAPIGMQNLYVIQSAIQFKRFKAMQIAWITIFFDITLALACFMGMGLVLEKFPSLKMAVLLIGSILVGYIGISLIRAKIDVNENTKKIEKSMIKNIANCFVVTWLNPQAIIDGTLLLGGFRASLEPNEAKLFIFGMCLASFLWFQFLSLGVSLFKKKLNSNFLKIINVICGSLLIFYSVKLLYTFIINAF